MKIGIQLDLSKIDKERIRPNKFTTRDGVEVSQQLYSLDVVPLKEKKFIKEGVGANGTKWQLHKTHFVAEKRDKGEETNYIGDGVQFTYADDEQVAPQETSEKTEDVTPEDIPF